MKKITLFLLCIMHCALCIDLKAQVFDMLLDGAAFSMASPNGKYVAGNIEDIAAYYNVKTKAMFILEGDIQDDGGCFVWDLNDKGQLAVEHKKCAAIWTEATDYEYLPLPEGLSAGEKAFSAARCISNDGKYVVVSFGYPTQSVYLYTLGEDGIFAMERMKSPEVAPIYNQIPQFIYPCGITTDGNRILSRFVVESGEYELPFVWERTSGGDWSIRWLALDFIVEGGKTDAVFPGTDVDFDGDMLEDAEEYNKAYEEWLQKLDDYHAIIDAASTGYFYQATAGDLSDFEMSENGKYAKMNISYIDFKSEDTIVYNYPVAINLETEEVCVFNTVENAACLSITNEGMVSFATPKVDYFRYGFVSSIADPTKIQTLTEWAKEKTNGAVDLAKYMTYSDDRGQTMLAEGSAVLFDNGKGFFTNQDNVFGEEERFESYFVFFDENTSVADVEDNDIVVYPNPTIGVLNFAGVLENIEIFDLLGRKVYTASVAENSINLSGLATGTYFLVAEQNATRVNVKFVVK